MAFSYQLIDRMGFGNMKCRVYKLTNVSNSGSSIDTGFKRVHFVRAVNQSDNADTFKESISSSVAGRVTFTAVTDGDDGYAMIFGE